MIEKQLLTPCSKKCVGRMSLVGQPCHPWVAVTRMVGQTKRTILPTVVSCKGRAEHRPCSVLLQVLAGLWFGMAGLQTAREPSCLQPPVDRFSLSLLNYFQSLHLGLALETCFFTWLLVQRNHVYTKFLADPRENSSWAVICLFMI